MTTLSSFFSTPRFESRFSLVPQVQALTQRLLAEAGLDQYAGTALSPGNVSGNLHCQHQPSRCYAPAQYFPKNIPHCPSPFRKRSIIRCTWSISLLALRLERRQGRPERLSPERRTSRLESGIPLSEAVYHPLYLVNLLLCHFPMPCESRHERRQGAAELLKYTLMG